MSDDQKQIESDERLAEQLSRDEEILYEGTNKQNEEIEAEVKQTQPLVSKKEPISALVSVYDAQNSAEYFQKAKDLCSYYESLRRIRGDGNCFYRSILFAQLEAILKDVDERKRFTQICKGWRQRLLKLGFPEFTTNDFCDWFDELLDDINNGKVTEESLFASLNDDGTSNYYVIFFRLITSGYLRENAEMFEGFVEGGRTVEQFCKEEIEPMWKDCDHLAIISLTSAIEVSIRIEYMNRSAAPEGGYHHDFISHNIPPRLYFLYRPEHYDILYIRNKC
uniref:Ubiquitin thioesterase n=1 Tax=Syphacia muris TaxID=451379 RepID=A0A0N5AAR6_9BILA